jgi:transposase
VNSHFQALWVFLDHLYYYNFVYYVLEIMKELKSSISNSFRCINTYKETGRDRYIAKKAKKKNDANKQDEIEQLPVNVENNDRFKLLL